MDRLQLLDSTSGSSQLRYFRETTPCHENEDNHISSPVSSSLDYAFDNSFVIALNASRCNCKVMCFESWIVHRYIISSVIHACLRTQLHSALLTHSLVAALVWSRSYLRAAEWAERSTSLCSSFLVYAPQLRREPSVASHLRPRIARDQ